jgi:hypothetical protein
MKINEFEPEASINKGQLEYIEMRPSGRGGYLKTLDVIKWLDSQGGEMLTTGRKMAEKLQRELST